jgi:uncharacterized protein (DUF885 family)
MRPFARLLLCSVILAGGSLAQASEAALESLMRDYTAFTREQDPVRAAERGDRLAATRWPDNSPATIARRAKTLESLGARLAAADIDSLSGAEALERDWLRWRVSVQREGIGFDAERINFVSGDGFYTVADYAALNTTPQSTAEAEAWITRLRAIPAFYRAETANLRRGTDTSFTQPRMTVERAIADLEERAGRPAEASPLLAPLKKLPAGMPPAARERLLAAGTDAIRIAVLPAERELLAFLKRDYLPRARPGIGASTLPRGAAWYRYLVRMHTTTSMTPEQIHSLGESEVKRIRAAMDAVIAETGFKGDFPAFLALARSDKRFYTDAADWGEKAAEVAKRADGLLPRFFGLLPRLPYGVVPIPTGLENSSAGYLAGSPERGIAGSVVYKPWLAEKLPTFGIAAWVLHEGAPGHHLQIALAQEREGAPEYRRNDDITAFVEGWGLYSEKLGEDMGIYRDPWERFGRLSLEMWRACRLVMDTGMHAMGWSRERAGACLRENSALADAEIDFELDRYIAWPGQALAYKVGEQTILRLRREAEAELGDRFDIRAFHDTVLGSGALPLVLLEQRVRAWISAQKS